MPAILWSIDSHDWKTLNITKNIRAIDNAKDGDILIMHDIHETSVESIPMIIDVLRKKGFDFVTVSELLSLSKDNTEV
jgi:peptidoglycan/xylan/chitin deacetylase (PgdA/CDA1 family)